MELGARGQRDGTERPAADHARVGRRSATSRIAAVVALGVLAGALTVGDAAADPKKARRDDRGSNSKGRHEASKGREVSRGRQVTRTVERHRSDGRYERRTVERWRSNDRGIRSRPVERRYVTHHAPPRCEVPRYYAPPPRRVVYWRERPYQWNVNVGVYMSDVWFNVSLGDVAPAGHYYYDRRCDTRFTSLYAYRDHCHSHNHAAVIDVVAIGDSCDDSYAYEPGWAAAEYDDDGWDD